jgi:predicted TIM-barrel fold metal-dependent hydrolase
MTIDSHCHLFTPRIVANMEARPDLVAELGLRVKDALRRLDPAALQQSAEQNNVEACILLPSTGPDRIRAENDRFIAVSRKFSRVRTLGTLHPLMHDPEDEVSRMLDLGIPGFKFSSFSQKCAVDSPEFLGLLQSLERSAGRRGMQPVLVFDTFRTADTHFAANPDHLTTPARLGRLVERYPGITFVGAHMGGLLSDFDEIRRELQPRHNLYLDTSNATHTLSEDQFVELLRVHGPSHVLFGTDWPWFFHGEEQTKVRGLMAKAGFDATEQEAVLGENARKVFGLQSGESADATLG